VIHHFQNTLSTIYDLSADFLPLLKNAVSQALYVVLFHTIFIPIRSTVKVRDVTSRISRVILGTKINRLSAGKAGPKLEEKLIKFPEMRPLRCWIDSGRSKLHALEILTRTSNNFPK
jgi:hypothetical protein